MRVCQPKKARFGGGHVVAVAVQNRRMTYGKSLVNVLGSCTGDDVVMLASFVTLQCPPRSGM